MERYTPKPEPKEEEKKKPKSSKELNNSYIPMAIWKDKKVPGTRGLKR